MRAEAAAAAASAAAASAEAAGPAEHLWELGARHPMQQRAAAPCYNAPADAGAAPPAAAADPAAAASATPRRRPLANSTNVWAPHQAPAAPGDGGCGAAAQRPAGCATEPAAPQHSQQQQQQVVAASLDQEALLEAYRAAAEVNQAIENLRSLQQRFADSAPAVAAEAPHAPLAAAATGPPVVVATTQQLSEMVAAATAAATKAVALAMSKAARRGESEAKRAAAAAAVAHREAGTQAADEADETPRRETPRPIPSTPVPDARAMGSPAKTLHSPARSPGPRVVVMQGDAATAGAPTVVVAPQGPPPATAAPVAVDAPAGPAAAEPAAAEPAPAVGLEPHAEAAQPTEAGNQQPASHPPAANHQPPAPVPLPPALDASLQRTLAALRDPAAAARQDRAARTALRELDDRRQADLEAAAGADVTVRRLVGERFDYAAAKSALEGVAKQSKALAGGGPAAAAAPQTQQLQQGADAGGGGARGDIAAAVPPLVTFYESEDAWRDAGEFAKVRGGVLGRSS